MSKKLALSSALSVMMMATFVLFGHGTHSANGSDSALFNVPGKVAVENVPALPALPGQR